MLQEFRNDGDGWYLIGYDGVARDIQDNSEEDAVLRAMLGSPFSPLAASVRGALAYREVNVCLSPFRRGLKRR